jgi:serine/threonine protein kinase
MPQRAANNQRNNRGGNQQTTPSPPLKSELQYQLRPRKNWVIVKEIGSLNGALNDGLAKVEIKDDPFDRFFFEKRFLMNPPLYHKEISLLRQLGDWPGVVKMVDHFVDERRGKASVYMEYCDVGDFSTIIQGVRKGNKPVHERKIWQWFISLMDTLVYMHRGPEPEDDRKVMLYWNCVYHRDIKPDNILLKTEHREGKIVAKMADFGCSVSAQWNHIHKRGNPDGVSKASALTPGYDPPEHPGYSGATDVWQLALAIACACTGIITPRSPENRSGQAWDKSRPAGPKYSSKLNEMLRWCLTEDKRQRPTPLAITKRLKTEYAAINLPPDNEPLQLFGESGVCVTHNLWLMSSSGPARGAGVPDMRQQRPGIPHHAFSESDVQGMGHEGGRYGGFAQDHQMASMGENADGGHAPPHLPGGFTPGFGHNPFPPGRGSGRRFYGGPDYFPHPGSYPRRGW